MAVASSILLSFQALDQQFRALSDQIQERAVLEKQRFAQHVDMLESQKQTQLATQFVERRTDLIRQAQQQRVAAEHRAMELVGRVAADGIGRTVRLIP